MWKLEDELKFLTVSSDLSDNFLRWTMEMILKEMNTRPNEYIQVILFFTKTDFDNINFPNMIRSFKHHFFIFIVPFLGSYLYNGTFLVWLN